MKNLSFMTGSSAQAAAELQAGFPPCPRPPGRRVKRFLGLCILVSLMAAPPTQAARPTPQAQEPASARREAVGERTATLQRQVSSLSEKVVAHLGKETLGPNDVKAIVEVLALQRAVEVFANLVASHDSTADQDILVQTLPMVEEYLLRAEEALAEAPLLGKQETPAPPSAAHPVSIRSTLEEIRADLGLTKPPPIATSDAAEQEPYIDYLGPQPSDDELQIVQLNLQRLREASGLMGQGKCYREFWTRNCADALEYHALPHQKRSFVTLLVSTRDLLRKYCGSPKLIQSRKDYEGLVRQLTVRPILYDYGSHTAPFVERPGLLALQCP